MIANPDNKTRLILALILANLFLTLWGFLRTPGGTIPEHPDTLDTTLRQQADFLVKRIKAVGRVKDKNVVEATQLWREAQLTLEAYVVSGDTKDLNNLVSSATGLQYSIANAIPDLIAAAYAKARQENSLRNGLAKWAGAGAYLALYPNDGTPAGAEAAQKMGYQHESIRQELLQKAQTRYNLWASEQIKKAWVDIKDVNSPVSKSDNTKFFHSCVH